jgi:hypothetical protein
LENAAVGGAVCEERWDGVDAAAYAEGADGSLLDFGLEEGEEGVVGEVVGFGFVEEPEVDVDGAEGAEAAIKRGFGFGGGEAGLFGWASCSAGGFLQLSLDAGKLFDDWSRYAAGGFEQS